MAAVPSAVARRREAEEAALRAQGIDPNAPPVATLNGGGNGNGDSPAPDAPESTAPAGPDPRESTAAGGGETEQQLRERIAELEQEVRTNSGRSSTAQTELERSKRALDTVQENRQFLERTVQEQQESIEQLRKQLEESSRTATLSTTDRALAEFNEVPEPTAQELSTFGEDTVSFVTKLARKQVAAAVKPMVDRMKAIEGALGRLKDLDKLPGLEQSVKATAAQNERQASDEFFRKEILTYFPDFETVRDTDAWKTYLNQEVPGRGMKVGNLLTFYHNNHNSIGVRAVLTSYYDAKKAAPSRDSLAVPGKAQTEGKPNGAKPRFRASEYQVKLRQFINKKLPKADWETYKANFDAALNDDRVERDATI
jgi:hypothetical protein